MLCILFAALPNCFIPKIHTRIFWRILKEYSELLDQVDSVKEKLKSDVTAEPYNWLRHPEVEKRVKVYAEKTYNQGGFKKAFDKIEKMDAAKVKEYLKNLIKDNMIVGLEIIKE